MLLIIPVGEMVTIENKLEARIIQISIKKIRLCMKLRK